MYLDSVEPVFSEDCLVLMAIDARQPRLCRAHNKAEQETTNGEQ